MTARGGQLSLSLFIRAYGHHPAAWRHPQTARSSRPDLAYWVRLARRAEAAKLDAVFVADFAGQAVEQLDRPGAAPPGYHFEPLTLMAALAGATQRIGLIATASTNLNAPFHLARSFASLDLLSGGRTGWNIVTSLAGSAAGAAGIDGALPHAERYRRAIESVAVCKAFWDSWDDDAFDSLDKQARSGIDSSAGHRLTHYGAHFAANGVSDLARPIQGHPVLVQAGNSEEGRDFTAQVAEMVYCTAQSLDVAQAYYADVKGRMARFGRDPSALLVTPGLMPIVGSSQQEADDKLGALQNLHDPNDSLRQFGFDLSGFPLDGPLPDLPEVDNHKGRHAQMIAFARKGGLTVRQLIAQFTVFRGHYAAVGTAASIADMMELWSTSSAADGFNLIPPLLPSGFDDFATLVLPELRRRGLFRSDYAGATLRDHLGLARPADLSRV